MIPTQIAPIVKEKRPSSILRGLLLGIILALVVLGGALLAITGFGVREIGQLLRGGELHISVDQPTVIRQIRALQRLETVSYSMDKIVSGARENPVLPSFLAGDRLLLMVHGEVIAGVDLSKLQPSDVVVHGRNVSIQLPPAEIFTTRLDSAKTQVYSRDTGLFSTPDPQLESEVRVEAEKQLEGAALQDGVLNTAAKNGRQTLTSLLTGLGFANVEFH